jgi:hypothetical protein
LTSIEIILLEVTKDNLLNKFEIMDIGEIQYFMGI